jgi:hypothetical protein
MLREALANLTAAAHLTYFFGVVAGFVCIILGPPRWTWTRNIWFRLAHAVAIAIVLVENTFGLACPLNAAEWQLRTSTTGAQEATAGVGSVLDRLLFHVISGRALNGLWWLFGVLAVAFWVTAPPRFRRDLTDQRRSPAE